MDAAMTPRLSQAFRGERNCSRYPYLSVKPVKCVGIVCIFRDNPWTRFW